LKTPS
jgi:hypothetical protein